MRKRLLWLNQRHQVEVCVGVAERVGWSSCRRFDLEPGLWQGRRLSTKSCLDVTESSPDLAKSITNFADSSSDLARSSPDLA